MLRLQAKVALTNTSAFPIVVYLGRPLIVEVDLAPTADLMAAEAFTLRQEGFLTIESEDKPILKTTFKTLQPGQSVTLSERESIFVPVAGSPASFEASAGLPGPGSYVLQLVIRTWTQGEQITSLWSQKWSPTGSLWTGAVRTKMIPLEIVKDPEVESCGP